MKKSVAKSSYKIGDIVFITSESDAVCKTVDTAISAVKVSCAFFDTEPPEVFPVIQLKVVSIRQYGKVDDPEYDRGYTPITSASEDVYKVIRNNTNRDIVIMTRGMDEVVRLQWPESKPFHDALGPIENVRQIIYVSALNVDGNYRLIEVLDDQDW